METWTFRAPRGRRITRWAWTPIWIGRLRRTEDKATIGVYLRLGPKARALQWRPARLKPTKPPVDWDQALQQLIDSGDG